MQSTSPPVQEFRRLHAVPRPRHRDRPVPSSTGADVLRVITDPRTPVFLTAHADGRRRYSYWQPFDSATGRGSCYVALPTDECDALHSAGKIALGEPLVDPAKTTYRVRPARTPAVAVRPTYPRARARVA